VFEAVSEVESEVRSEIETESAVEKEAAYRAALDSAVRSLGRREHGRRELERKLMSKRHDPALIARVLDYLIEHDLQSESRYVEAYVRSRIRKGYGPVKIRQELSSRGVGEESESELELELTQSAEFWIEVAETVLEKKFGRVPADRDDWHLQARFLSRRGFPSDLIFRALGAYSD